MLNVLFKTRLSPRWTPYFTATWNSGPREEDRYVRAVRFDQTWPLWVRAPLYPIYPYLLPLSAWGGEFLHLCTVLLIRQLLGNPPILFIDLMIFRNLQSHYFLFQLPDCTGLHFNCLSGEDTDWWLYVVEKVAVFFLSEKELISTLRLQADLDCRQIWTAGGPVHMLIVCRAEPAEVYTCSKSNRPQRWWWCFSQVQLWDSPKLLEKFYSVMC